MSHLWLTLYFCWKGYSRAIKRVTGLEIKIEVVDHPETESNNSRSGESVSADADIKEQMEVEECYGFTDKE